MHDEWERVRVLIERAFRDVRLGEGIGLWEAQAIDDYADAQTRQQSRDRDEKEDWRRISREALEACYSSLSFFDAEGMRFHLPAFLTAEIAGMSTAGPVFHLTSFDWHAPQPQFALLNTEQCCAVREFLLLIRDVPRYEYERPLIIQALEAYWTKR
jgi:hypothetical protein